MVKKSEKILKKNEIKVGGIIYVSGDYVEVTEISPAGNPDSRLLMIMVEKIGNTPSDDDLLIH